MRDFQAFSEKYIDIAYLDIGVQEKSVLYAMLFLEAIRGVGGYTYEDLHQYSGIYKDTHIPRSPMALSIESLLSADLVERMPLHGRNWPPLANPKSFFEFRIRWEVIDDRKRENVEVVREVSFR